MFSFPILYIEYLIILTPPAVIHVRNGFSKKKTKKLNNPNFILIQFLMSHSPSLFPQQKLSLELLPPKKEEISWFDFAPPIIQVDKSLYYNDLSRPAQELAV